MIGILKAVICLGNFCQAVYVPTPITFECSQSFAAKEYLDVKYPHWVVREYDCNNGRYA